MSELQRILDLLNDTDAMVAQERRPSTEVDDLFAMNIASIEKRRDDLVRRLDRVLHTQQHEFVRYRIHRTWSDEYPVKAIATAMEAFQDLVTAVFDAIRYGPKIRFRPSVDSIELSTFRFAGASPGSVLLSMAVPNDRLLVGETELDRALELVERAVSARESTDLQLLAREIGIAAISKAYAWAQVNVAYKLDTEIAWGKDYATDHSVAISSAESELIRDLIAEKSDVVDDEVVVDCTLLGFDGATSYFHIETIGERIDIRGNLSPNLSKTWVTSSPYRARLEKRTRIQYATGKESELWTLVDLSPLTLPLN